jgi:hypothetical protein
MKHATVVRKQMFIDRKKQQLPEQIDIIEQDNVILGYKIYDPIKQVTLEFKEKTERWNLHAAKKYVIHMHRRDVDKSFVSYEHALDELRKINTSFPFTELQYMNPIIYFDTIIVGFNIEITKASSSKTGLPKYYKAFDDPTKPLLQLFYECIQDYANLLQQPIHIPSMLETNETMKSMKEHLQKTKKKSKKIEKECFDES